jgi:hypothetical protein
MDSKLKHLSQIHLTTIQKSCHMENSRGCKIFSYTCQLPHQDETLMQFFVYFSKRKTRKTRKNQHSSRDAHGYLSQLHKP